MNSSYSFGGYKTVLLLANASATPTVSTVSFFNKDGKPVREGKP